MPSAEIGRHDVPATNADADVWYVSYGSNASAERFLTYLKGGVPPGSSVAERGARDPAPPTAVRAVTLPHQLTFGLGGGRRWGPGGVAFLDPAGGSGTAWAVAYRITRAQFFDVVAEENHRSLGSLEMSLPVPGQISVLDPTTSRGWYRALVGCDEIDALPAVTFTNPGVVIGETPAPLAYLRTIGLGLIAGGFGDAAAVASYLAAAPGVLRSSDEIEASIHGALPDT